jgi:predicted trehalose synthase
MPRYPDAAEGWAMPDTQERRLAEAQDEMASTVGELQEGSDRLGQRIDATKETWNRTKSSQSTPTAAGDWEDTDDAAGGEDASGFDDPETVEDDEEAEDEEDDE